MEEGRIFFHIYPVITYIILQDILSDMFGKMGFQCPQVGDPRGITHGFFHRILKMNPQRLSGKRLGITTLGEYIKSSVIA